MLAERDAVLDAEHESSGRSAVWRHVYNLMHCPGPSCSESMYCLRVRGKHFRLSTSHLIRLVRHAESGCQLGVHEGVPDDIRLQVYTEEQQRMDRQRAKRVGPPRDQPPISITNVLPNHADPAGQSGL